MDTLGDKVNTHTTQIVNYSFYCKQGKLQIHWENKSSKASHPKGNLYLSVKIKVMAFSSKFDDSPYSGSRSEVK